MRSVSQKSKDKSKPKVSQKAVKRKSKGSQKSVQQYFIGFVAEMLCLGYQTVTGTGWWWNVRKELNTNFFNFKAFLIEKFTFLEVYKFYGVD